VRNYRFYRLPLESTAWTLPPSRPPTTTTSLPDWRAGGFASALRDTSCPDDPSRRTIYEYFICTRTASTYAVTAWQKVSSRPDKQKNNVNGSRYDFFRRTSIFDQPPPPSVKNWNLATGRLHSSPPPGNDANRRFIFNVQNLPAHDEKSPVIFWNSRKNEQNRRWKTNGVRGLLLLEKLRNDANSIVFGRCFSRGIACSATSSPKIVGVVDAYARRSFVAIATLISRSLPTRTMADVRPRSRSSGPTRAHRNARPSFGALLFERHAHSKSLPPAPLHGRYGVHYLYRSIQFSALSRFT